MTTIDLDSARTTLHAERERLVHQLKELGADDSGELTGDIDYDDAFADAAAATSERTETLGLVENLGADRDAEDHILAILASALLAHAVLAAFGEEMLLVAKIDEGVETVHRLGPDIAAATTIAAIRPAEFDELLAPEADATATTAARADRDLGEIEEFHLWRLLAGSAQAIHDHKVRLKPGGGLLVFAVGF